MKTPPARATGVGVMKTKMKLRPAAATVTHTRLPKNTAQPAQYGNQLGTNHDVPLPPLSRTPETPATTVERPTGPTRPENWLTDDDDDEILPSIPDSDADYTAPVSARTACAAHHAATHSHPRKAHSPATSSRKMQTRPCSRSSPTTLSPPPHRNASPPPAQPPPPAQHTADTPLIPRRHSFAPTSTQSALS
ncbi:hypothetical protein BWQ96_10907 [Gracilariopsis chorda]|uniref:Uncharacterized protein n=1 Tax=Gracilariopsis chorda TaxID=448386 RepID=A0A2V3IBA3_9FLOR|nr:hypothetical protein BWQ96_10907 [Gracilariopsis chorda]|eukprot:PXF39402.1 hypothetical protein BWQ96_10907 [Gracilariopsis chorda]